MTDVFRRMDVTGREMDKSSLLSSQFKFYSVFVADISPTAPSEELQGFLSADVILEIKYSRITDGAGRYV